MDEASQPAPWGEVGEAIREVAGQALARLAADGGLAAAEVVSELRDLMRDVLAAGVPASFGRARTQVMAAADALRDVAQGTDPMPALDALLWCLRAAQSQFGGDAAVSVRIGVAECLRSARASLARA